MYVKLSVHLKKNSCVVLISEFATKSKIIKAARKFRNTCQKQSNVIHKSSIFFV